MNEQDKKNLIKDLHKIMQSTDKPVFEVIIKQDGKTIYHDEAYAGVVSVAEKEGDYKFDKEDGTIEGITQKFSFGHPALQFHAFDQLGEMMNNVLFTYIRKLTKNGD